ncbi:MAG TPA: DUF302 domain-containing protein [Rhizomicrobium sp.]|jgi:uncharacterized protein (DUF302 family)|nr:DUF302 domain-containing protein [Rhizomicrobium sp.]
MNPLSTPLFASAFAVLSFSPVGIDAANAAAMNASAQTHQLAADEGVIRVKSAYGVDETVARIKADIAKKGIKFFDDIDQAKLGEDAGIKLNSSRLLVFGNPPLGIQFLTSNPYAGLDWPVRMLVLQDADGQVWIAYTDFTYIAHRHHITDRDAQFAMATMVAGSIASAAQAK